MQGKRVLVRADLNVPMDADCNISDDTRIRAAIPTLKYLVDNGAKVLLTSHLVRLYDPGTLSMCQSNYAELGFPRDHPTYVCTKRLICPVYMFSGDVRSFVAIFPRTCCVSEPESANLGFVAALRLTVLRSPRPRASPVTIPRARLKFVEGNVWRSVLIS